MVAGPCLLDYFIFIIFPFNDPVFICIKFEVMIGSIEWIEASYWAVAFSISSFEALDIILKDEGSLSNEDEDEQDNHLIQSMPVHISPHEWSHN